MITLPMGSRNRSYILDIRVVVQDAIGVEVVFDSYVQVRAAKEVILYILALKLHSSATSPPTHSTTVILVYKY